MAKARRTGWKSYLPTLRGGVQILIALVAIKVLVGAVGSSIPTKAQAYVPSL